jgi:hypothetical protein
MLLLLELDHLLSVPLPGVANDSSNAMATAKTLLDQVFRLVGNYRSYGSARTILTNIPRTVRGDGTKEIACLMWKLRKRVWQKAGWDLFDDIDALCPDQQADNAESNTYDMDTFDWEEWNRMVDKFFAIAG